GPDIGDDDRVGGRERRRELVDESGRPMVRQRLVDAPDATPGLPRPDRLDRGAYGRRMVAVVVVDDDTGGFALALEPATDTGKRLEPVHDVARRKAKDLGYAG